MGSYIPPPWRKCSCRNYWNSSVEDICFFSSIYLFILLFLSVWTYGCLFYTLNYNSVILCFFCCLNYSSFGQGSFFSVNFCSLGHIHECRGFFLFVCFSISLLSGTTRHSRLICIFPAPALESVISLRSPWVTILILLWVTILQDICLHQYILFWK